MLRLPGGRIVDISTDRARYHALRRPGIDLHSAHRPLYSLVDVIYRRLDDSGMPRRGWTEYDYDFSGYTLETVRFADDWSEEDKIALSQWLQQASQQQRIETARRRLIEQQQKLSVKHYSAPQYLYSQLRERLLALTLQRATATQWRNTIRNMQQHGVREEEILWSGLHDYLTSQSSNARLTKQQILDNLNLSSIRLDLNIEQIWGANGGLSFQEVAKRMPHQAVYRAALKLDNTCHCVLRYVDRCYNYRVGVVKTLHNGHRMALNKYWFALDPYGRAITNPDARKNKTRLFFASSIDAKIAADQHAREHLGMRSGASNYTHFDHLTLYGGHDYREWLVSLPDFQRIFFGAHFYDHNVLLHIRTTARTDNAGRKLLFIEEVQSDWHQSGKRYGYNNTYWGQVANAPFKQDWPALAIKLMLIHASQNGFDGIAWPRGDIQERRYGQQLHSIKQHYDREIPKALNRLGRPFNCQVETTEINTRDPWLNLERTQNKWRVADGNGKFKTRAKYNNREEAMAVIARHCREIDLTVPVFFICETLRQQIATKGLPLFGETVT